MARKSKKNVSSTFESKELTVLAEELNALAEKYEYVEKSTFFEGGNEFRLVVLTSEKSGEEQNDND